MRAAAAEKGYSDGSHCLLSGLLARLSQLGKAWDLMLRLIIRQARIRKLEKKLEDIKVIEERMKQGETPLGLHWPMPRQVLWSGETLRNCASRWQY